VTTACAIHLGYFPAPNLWIKAAAAGDSGAAIVQTDISYFLQRAAEERTAALNVRNPKAREAHLDFAERYEARVRLMTSRHERLFFPLAAED